MKHYDVRVPVQAGSETIQPPQSSCPRKTARRGRDSRDGLAVGARKKMFSEREESKLPNFGRLELSNRLEALSAALAGRMIRLLLHGGLRGGLLIAGRHPFAVFLASWTARTWAT